MTARHLRPSPDWIIERRRPAPPADDVGFWSAVGVICLIVALGLAGMFLALDGIARAFDRPEACRTLTAAECSAYHQESRK